MPKHRHIPRVAVLIETSRAYGRGLLEGVARYIREQGPWSLYFKPQGLGEPPPPWLRRWDGDGILARIDDRRMARAVRATRLPAVDLRGRLPNLGLARVGVDNRILARLAYAHLRERGYRRFGFCGLPRGAHPHLDGRCDDFVRLVEQGGDVCSVFQPRRRNESWDREQQQLTSWLVRLPRPCGIMACNDDRGLQLLDACRRGGVVVPDDIAVIGVDNDPLVCALATPPLTSIDVNPQRVGFEAAALLARMMRGGNAPKRGLFFDQCRVVTRQSTDALALEDADLARAVRFIRDRACSGLRVDDVLDEVPLSRSVLERRFKQMLGRTPKAEILAVQMEHARQLLIDTKLSLEEVASRCGFRGAKYFSDIFLLKVGTRPAKYRHGTRLGET
jgi:LacI family transcriptional regulator